MEKLKNMIFVRRIDNKTTLRHPGKKGPGKTITVNSNKVKRIPKSIGSTRKRQKNKRQQLVRKKRGLKTTTTTEELSDDFSPTYYPRSPPSPGPTYAPGSPPPLSPRSPPPWMKKSDNIENLFDSMKLK